MELTDAIRENRDKWIYRGDHRPDFAIAPQPGQESVWDYPRPPRLEPEARRVRVQVAGETLADTLSGCRVLETAGPPTVYIRPEDIDHTLLLDGESVSVCEWKGLATSVHLLERGEPGREVGWRYCDVFSEFSAIRGWYSFYPSRVDCFLADEHVRPQPGGYYGGWITDELVGPFKGEPGTENL